MGTCLHTVQSILFPEPMPSICTPGKRISDSGCSRSRCFSSNRAKLNSPALWLLRSASSTWGTTYYALRRKTTKRLMSLFSFGKPLPKATPPSCAHCSSGYIDSYRQDTRRTTDVSRLTTSPFRSACSHEYKESGHFEVLHAGATT